MCIDDKRYTGSFRPKWSTSSIKGTILTVIKLSGRTTPPSHLYCNVLFFVIGLFIFSNFSSAHPPSLKLHHQSSLRPLWEHRKSLVCLLFSLSFCSLCWEEMRGSRNDRRAWFGFECVCWERRLDLARRPHTKTLNTRWPLTHTPTLISHRPLPHRESYQA